MNFIGTNFLAELGWAIGDKTKPNPFILTPLVGYGYNRINFSRSAFKILGTVAAIGEVDEDYDVHYVNLGTKLNWNITNKFLADLKGSWGVVFYNRMDNELLGSIDGDGGFIPKFELEIKYLATSDVTLIIGGFYEFQHLDGDVSGAVEWPDNDLTSYGFTLGGSFKWGPTATKKTQYKARPSRLTVELEEVNRTPAYKYCSVRQPVAVTRQRSVVRRPARRELSVEERLKRLDDFYERGLISETKYLEERKVILGNF